MRAAPLPPPQWGRRPHQFGELSASKSALWAHSQPRRTQWPSVSHSGGHDILARKSGEEPMQRGRLGVCRSSSPHWRSAARTPSRAADMAVSQYGRVTATLPWAVAMEKGYFAGRRRQRSTTSSRARAAAPRCATCWRAICPMARSRPRRRSRPSAPGSTSSSSTPRATTSARSRWSPIRRATSTTSQDLQGRKAGFTGPKSTSELLLRLALKQAGMSDQVEPVATGGFGGGLTLLDTGGIDAAPLIDPILTLKPDKYRVIFHFADLIPRMTWLVGVTTRKFATEHPDTVRKLIDDPPPGRRLHLRASRRGDRDLRQGVAAGRQGGRDLFPEIFRLQGRMVARRLRPGGAGEDVRRPAADRRRRTGPVDWKAVIDQQYPAQGFAEAVLSVTSAAARTDWPRGMVWRPPRSDQSRRRPHGVRRARCSPRWNCCAASASSTASP